MRCYQHVGLTEEAELFLKENVKMVPHVVCPKCQEVISHQPRVLKSKVVDMFYGDGPSCNTYELKDGRVAEEVVQVAPWSSGPMGFMCLVIDGKPHFEWVLDSTVTNEYDKRTGRFYV